MESGNENREPVDKKPLYFIMCFFIFTSTSYCGRELIFINANCANQHAPLPADRRRNFKLRIEKTGRTTLGFL